MVVWMKGGRLTSIGGGGLSSTFKRKEERKRKRSVIQAVLRTDNKRSIRGWFAISMVVWMKGGRLTSIGGGGLSSTFKRKEERKRKRSVFLAEFIKSFRT
jgi:hypothetical protein